MPKVRAKHSNKRYNPESRLLTTMYSCCPFNLNSYGAWSASWHIIQSKQQGHYSVMKRNNQRNYVLVLALLLIFCCLVIKSCLTLCDHMDWSLPGSSDHEISQARILEWVTTSCSRGSSQPRDRTGVSSIAGGFFTTEPPGKSLLLTRFYNLGLRNLNCSFHTFQ